MCENLEIARRANEPFNAGEIEAAFALFHPEVEFRDLQHAPDLPEAVNGRDAVGVVLAHWSDAYDELKVDAVIVGASEKAGHRLIAPTYTGLGERSHLANPAIDLETHIQDILNVIKFEDLSDIVLLGHSYGGMVATGVADRARERVTQLIYLDAFVPRDGQSLFDRL